MKITPQNIILAGLALYACGFAQHAHARGFGRIGHIHSSYGWHSSHTGYSRRSSYGYGLRPPGEHYARSYIRRNGSYVPGHYATMPNQTKLDNWSTRGNINPHTGREGTKNPY